MTDERRKAFETQCIEYGVSPGRDRTIARLFWNAACDWMESRLDSPEVVEKVQFWLKDILYHVENIEKEELSMPIFAYVGSIKTKAKAALAALKGSL